jgi:hypothetical protein
MRELSDARVLGYKFEVIPEGSFPAQRFMFAAQIFQAFTDIKCFVAILLLHSLETSSAFAHWTACGERTTLVKQPPHSIGEGGLKNGCYLVIRLTRA